MNSSENRVPIDTTDVWPEDSDENEGIVINWFTSEGNRIDEGEIVCEIQVEKVDIEIPAPTAGELDEIVLDEDTEFERGDTLAWVLPA